MTLYVTEYDMPIIEEEDFNVHFGGTGGVTGVKGNAETHFRKGDVNITPEDIGIEIATSADLLAALFS